MERKVAYLLWYILLLVFCNIALSQNAIIVVIDGVRYSESIGVKDRNIPRMWNKLRPFWTIWTNFQNDGLTKTDPGHATIVTGVWQFIDNKGIQRPQHPTIFEYFRKATGSSEKTCYVVVGKYKLDILTNSNHPDYGSTYKASLSIGEDDTSVVNDFKTILSTYHPRLAIVNLSGTDISGHSGNWIDYIAALHQADSLVSVIWQTLQTDTFYKKNTTLFIVNDHGRHDDAHGGFEDHGDSCEGCRHVMLLAIGRGVPENKVISEKHTQCDIAPTIGRLLSFATSYTSGVDLLQATASSK